MQRAGLQVLAGKPSTPQSRMVPCARRNPTGVFVVSCQRQRRQTKGADAVFIELFAVSGFMVQPTVSKNPAPRLAYREGPARIVLPAVSKDPAPRCVSSSAIALTADLERAGWSATQSPAPVCGGGNCSGMNRSQPFLALFRRALGTQRCGSLVSQGEVRLKGFRLPGQFQTL